LSRGRSISICLYEKKNVVTWKWLPGKYSFAVLASLCQELSLGEPYFFIWIYYNTLFGINKPKSAAMVAKYPNKTLNKARKKTSLNFFYQINPPRCFQTLQKYPPPPWSFSRIEAVRPYSLLGPTLEVLMESITDQI
jgi:hypothetical protein